MLKNRRKWDNFREAATANRWEDRTSSVGSMKFFLSAASGEDCISLWAETPSPSLVTIILGTKLWDSPVYFPLFFFPLDLVTPSHLIRYFMHLLSEVSSTEGRNEYQGNIKSSVYLYPLVRGSTWELCLDFLQKCLGDWGGLVYPNSGSATSTITTYLLHLQVCEVRWPLALDPHSQ